MDMGWQMTRDLGLQIRDGYKICRLGVTDGYRYGMAIDYGDWQVTIGYRLGLQIGYNRLLQIGVVCRKKWQKGGNVMGELRGNIKTIRGGTLVTPVPQPMPLLWSLSTIITGHGYVMIIVISLHSSAHGRSNFNLNCHSESQSDSCNWQLGPASSNSSSIF